MALLAVSTGSVVEQSPALFREDADREYELEAVKQNPKLLRDDDDRENELAAAKQSST